MKCFKRWKALSCTYGTIPYKLEIVRQRFFGNTAIGRKLERITSKAAEAHPNSKALCWLAGAMLPF